ncbi:MAG: hypothetical protein F4Y84_21270 [Caldilineaceae bacterium SB0665_bin_25]|nr:hypothetical protein [Caldilineaceae bacterium SB0665_bin_25]
MRTAVALTTLLLTLITLTSCAARSETEQPTAAPTVNQQPAQTATPTVPPTVSSTATPTPVTSPASTPESPNVALLATGRVSSGEDSVHFATDGDPETVWNAQNFPAQWISIALDGLYLVERIELVVAQAPSGPTTHILWVDNGSGVRTRFRHLSDIYTEDGQTLAIEMKPPRPIREILIQTLDSPSWVAWREVRIYGSPHSLQNESEAQPPMQLEKILDELVLPVQVTHAGDGSGRIFVVEQQGRINIVKNGVANDTLFLDISDRVNCCEERGLFNVAFPPAFHTSQRFYLSYSNSNDDTVVSRFTTTDDADVADPASEEILLIVDQPHVAHNGGRLAFGPRDGYMYVGMGDGGSEGPPVHFSQDPKQLLGKILRIDVESGVEPYAIPPGNPFVADESYRDEIWALGLRNPWGFAFDQQTGELYLPDAGHNDREELNYVPPSSPGGQNYGWPTIEGTRCMRFPDLPVTCREAMIFELPVAEYDHTRGCSIVGGAVYRGTELPQLTGHFVFADFCRGDIWSITREDNAEDPAESQAARQPWLAELIVPGSVPVSSIGEDEEGNLYVTGYADGAVYKIVQNPATE